MAKRKKSKKKTPEQQLKAADKMVKRLLVVFEAIHGDLAGWRNKKC